MLVGFNPDNCNGAAGIAQWERGPNVWEFFPTRRVFFPKKVARGIATLDARPPDGFSSRFHTMKKILIPLLSAGLALLAVVPARAQATLYGIGDLAGGKTYSQVNDATKVGGVIYAVGGSTDTSATNNNDRAVLWTSTGGLTAIPDFVTHTGGQGGVIATAIASDGTQIAARLHDNTTTAITSAALVTTSGLTSVNLGNLGSGLSSQANGLADNGTVLWGSVPYPASGAKTQLVSYTNSAGSISAAPFFSSGTNLASTNMFISSQAAVSADGNKVVGTTNNGGSFTTAGPQAFLYIKNTADLSADVPYLTGGTWNAGMAINSAGTLGLILGNSTAYANGELYLFTDQPSPTVTQLGSPNSAYSFVGGGSLNADGSLVSAAFNVSGANIGYIRNANGWFTLDSVASILART